MTLFRTFFSSENAEKMWLTGVIADENVALTSQELITFQNILKLFLNITQINAISEHKTSIQNIFKKYILHSCTWVAPEFPL